MGRSHSTLTIRLVSAFIDQPTGTSSSGRSFGAVVPEAVGGSSDSIKSLVAGLSSRAVKSVGVSSYPRAGGELSTSRARRLAAVRVSTPSFSKISRTCFFTVDSLLPRIIAISLFVLPWVSHSSVSATRGVKPNTVSSGLAESKLGLNCGTVCWTARSRRERMAARRSASGAALLYRLALSPTRGETGPNIGSLTVTAVPSPNLLSTSILPPCKSTQRFTISPQALKQSQLPPPTSREAGRYARDKGRQQPRRAPKRVRRAWKKCQAV